MLITRCKNSEEFKQFYNKYANKWIAPVEWLLGHSDGVFCFYDEITSELLGCIYIEGDKENRVCLSGFSKPKQMTKVIEAIKWVSNFMHLDDLYSHTECPPAKLVLLKSGFKKISNNLYKRSKF